MQQNGEEMETTTMSFQCSPQVVYKLWELDLIQRLEDIFGIDRLPLSVLAHIIGPIPCALDGFALPWLSPGPHTTAISSRIISTMQILYQQC